MTQDSNAILTLCSHICVGEGIQPLEPREYSELVQLLTRAGKTPGDLFRFTDADFSAVLKLSDGERARYQRLLDRNASLSFELSSYQNMGIDAVTRADAHYPRMLKKKLANGCPPIFYCAGDISLLDRPFFGYVGSRTVTQEDLDFTVQAVRKTTALGSGVVSGGAKGIDTIAGTEALLSGSFCVEYLSDSMLKKLKKSDTIRSIQQGRLLLLSVAKPDAGFQVGMAMMRNRYIYAQSAATVVVRSDLNKGGTWTGATENLKHNWCKLLCRDHPYPGNRALIQKGAIPIPDAWDGRIPEATTRQPSDAEYVQASLFDI